MFLQSQKKKSTIKPKTSERSRKRKARSRIKTKKKKHVEEEIQKEESIEVVIPDPIDVTEVPAPSPTFHQEEVAPVHVMPIQEPEMPIVMTTVPNPKIVSEFEKSENVKRNLRFNNRHGAKFGDSVEEIDESEGPQLFIYEDEVTEDNSDITKAQTQFRNVGHQGDYFGIEALGQQPKKDSYVHPNNIKYDNDGEAPFDVNGIFAEFKLNVNPEKKRKGHGVPANQRKAYSEVRPGMKFGKKMQPKRRKMKIFGGSDQSESLLDNQLSNRSNRGILQLTKYIRSVASLFRSNISKIRC